jgi:hypothetical protein
MNKPDPALVQQLRVTSVTDTHTLNKACYYYCGRLKATVRKELDTMIRQALVTKDWRPLKERMRRWF